MPMMSEAPNNCLKDLKACFQEYRDKQGGVKDHFFGESNKRRKKKVPTINIPFLAILLAQM